MSPRRTERASSGGGRVAVSVLLVLVVAIGLLLVVRAKPSPGPLDPRSEGPDGTRGLVLLLEDQGAEVELVRQPPAPGADARVLVLDDSLDDDQRAELLEFVERGGIAVVADPASTLHGGADEDGGSERVTGDLREVSGTSAPADANVDNESCTIGALEELRGVFVLDGLLFPVGPGEQHCLGDGNGHAFAIRNDIGSGVVVGLGDNRLFTNRLLRFADNSGLAVALLVPQPGARVAVVLGNSTSTTPDDIGSGDDTLGDLVRPGVWMGLAQLAVAFVVLAVARAVRPGRPVDEVIPTPVAGSEAVKARSTLMRRAGHAASAGWLLGTDVHRDMCDRYHLPRTASSGQIETAAFERDGIAPGTTTSLLTTETPDAKSLLELSNRIGQLRTEWTRIDADRVGATRGDF